jgi:hypothetical protein
MSVTFLNILVVVLLVVITGFWAAANMKGRGAFSALLAAVSTLASGAIAFGLWETVAMNVLMPLAGTSGFVAQLVEATLWGAALLIPFIISMIVFRLALDLIIRNNLELDAGTNFVGGAVFGLANAVVTAGIIVLAVGMMRLGPNMGLFGYDPVKDEDGPVVYDSDLWVPVDRWTVSLYEYLSLNAFKTGTPLALERPDLHVHAAMLRQTYSDTGLGRITLKPDDFEILGGYRIQSDDSIDLLVSGVALGRPVAPKLPTGEANQRGDWLAGLAVRFFSGAVDSGQVVVGPGQVRLLAWRGTGDSAQSIAVHPYAIITRSDQEFEGVNPETGEEFEMRFPFARYVVDGRDWFVGSVGGETSHNMIFEFVVPQGYEPRTLFVKGVPTPLDGRGGNEAVAFPPVQEIVGEEPVSEFVRGFSEGAGSFMDEEVLEQMEADGFAGLNPVLAGLFRGNPTPPLYRDVGMIEGDLFEHFGIPVPGAGGQTLAELGYDGTQTAPRMAAERDNGLYVSDRLPLRFTLTNNTRGSLAADEEREITGGEQTYEKNILLDRNIQRNQAIDRFSQSRTTRTVMMQLHSNPGTLTELGDVVARLPTSAVPALVDGSGQDYLPIGYVFVEGDQVTIRFTPDRPVRAMSSLPDTISQVKRDQEIFLIYRVTSGVDILGIADGRNLLTVFEPPLNTGGR